MWAWDLLKNIVSIEIWSCCSTKSPQASFNFQEQEFIAGAANIKALKSVHRLAQCYVKRKVTADSVQRDSAPCWIQAHDTRLTSTCKLLIVVTLLWLQPWLAIDSNSCQYCQRLFLILSSLPFLTWFSGGNFERFQTNSIQPLHYMDTVPGPGYIGGSGWYSCWGLNLRKCSHKAHIFPIFFDNLEGKMWLFTWWSGSSKPIQSL